MKHTTANSGHLEVIPLGGMGEIGKNILAYRYENEILVVDCGLAFPEAHMPGVDLVLPRIDYLIENAHLITGMVLTHGHEDHIGGLPYSLPRLPKFPIYGASLTLGLVREKLREFGIRESDVDLREADPDAKLRIGKHFIVDRFRMTHSIPDNSGYVLHTPVGKVVHTGDFKLDQHPTDGKPSNLAKVATAGEEGVLLLISDSTSAERSGYSPSEADVAEQIDKIVKNARGRVFLTTFASHVHRIQNVIRIAEKYGRRVVMEGRSMVKYAQVAQDLGYLSVKDPLISTDDLRDLQDSQVLFICTGSQGQPMSVLSRLAFGNHAKIALHPGDTIILSSSPIPGNEEAVNTVINRLYELGTDVYYPPTYGVHASGHGFREELEAVYNLARPKYFLPWHGEPRHQINHARMAHGMPSPPKRTVVAKNGDVIRVSQDDFRITGTVTAGAMLVDGLGIGDVSEDILQDRVAMSTDGLLLMTAVLHPTPHVELVSRGFVSRNAELEGTIRQVAMDVLTDGLRRKRPLEEIRDDMYGAVRKFVRQTTGRSPMLIPMLID